ncbi:flagellar basal body-associated protein FliL [Pelagivirga sediminicola]|uniref:Flagellar protein FliL n=1 Tax=Pelagivirga sediminicola TaxID=2170575 RepID=A0A2T7G5J6_9RHOB|nr:flagellar basal body-associated FliL family protein [Pelagivirga sediminicola]PVA09694.1 flagellar basal body-associated protein FliL [Pelagivirga sediminicola]
MKLLIPLILLLLGLGGGVGAGLMLRPAPDAAAEAPAAAIPAEDAGTLPASGADTAAPRELTDHDRSAGPGDREYIKLNNQFVVPIVSPDRLESVVVMSLSLEVLKGQSEMVYLREPKIRDEFLRVLFDHANMGGFRGTFTDTGKLGSLRNGLLEVARKTLGPDVKGVLITDITRQDM